MEEKQKYKRIANSKQLERQNNFIKENYKRVNLALKKEEYSIIEQYANNQGIKAGQFILDYLRKNLIDPPKKEETEKPKEENKNDYDDIPF